MNVAKRRQSESEGDKSAKKIRKLDEPSNGELSRDNGCENAESHQADDRNQEDDKKAQKRKRVRVKKLRRDVSKQMEFYFGDANLRRDRYMKELVAQGADGWVSVDEFLKFNKMKTLLNKKGLSGLEIAKAAQCSDLLEVSSDLSKVRRNLDKFPIKEKDEASVDDCTIYVQGLPPSMTMDSLRCLFSEFGSVEYVSLPLKASGEHKGFAFVEFTEKTGAENSCKFHNLRRGGTSFVSVEDDRPNRSLRPESVSLNSIQVISKREWMRYKQQYLKLRKESAKVTKKFLKTFASPSIELRNENNNGKQAEAATPRNEQANNHHVPGLNDAQNHVEPEEGGDDLINEGRLDGNGLGFIKGCIVKLRASRPLAKGDKAILREIPNVIYSDVMENDPIAFLRFSSIEQSQKFVEENVDLEKIEIESKLILEGQEEELYWAKVESMRQMKRNRGREKQRGRNKLQGRYENYMATLEKKAVFNKRIIFDD